MSVQYVRADPELSRIEGMKTPGESLWWLLVFTLGFGGAGMLVAYLGIQEANKVMQRVKLGIVTHATWTRQSVGSTDVILYFTSTDGQSCQFGAKGDTSGFAPGELKEVFYVPGAPMEAVLYDQLPARVRHCLTVAR